MDKIDALVFDLDSTLVKIEGLDWLAVHKKVDDKVVHLTKKSMDGVLDFNLAMIKKDEDFISFIQGF
jgi:phosphoserine phosphatase